MKQVFEGHASISTGGSALVRVSPARASAVLARRARPYAAALALLSTLTVLPSAHAAVVFSNFGQGDSFDGSTGWSVSDSIPQDVAMPFAVPLGSDYVFTSLNIALQGTPSPLTVQLRADAGGVPGAVIEALTVSTTGTASIVTGLSSTTPTLLAGTTYWIATDAPSGFEGGWQWTNPQLVGPTAFSFDRSASWNSFTQATSAFRVNGNPALAVVPEPGTTSLLLLAGVLLAVAHTRRGKRDSVRQ